MLKYRKGGAWADGSGVPAGRFSGSWRQFSNIYRRAGGAWTLVWTAYKAVNAYLSGSATYTNTSAASGTYSTGTVAANASQGTGSYTYTWSVTSGSGWTIVGQGTSSAYFSNYCKAGMSVSGTFQCVVSDGRTSVTLSGSMSLTIGQQL